MELQSLVSKTHNDIQLLLDEATGDVYLSEAGYCALADVEPELISNRCMSYTHEMIKRGRINRPNGKEEIVNLINAKLAFYWIINDHAPLGIQIGELGMVHYLRELSKPTPPQDSTQNSV